MTGLPNLSEQIFTPFIGLMEEKARLSPTLITPVKKVVILLEEADTKLLWFRETFH
jgi:hypothetical protein